MENLVEPVNKSSTHPWEWGYPQNPPFLHPTQLHIHLIWTLSTPLFTPYFRILTLSTPFYSHLILTLFTPIHTLTCNCPHNCLTPCKKNCSVCTNVNVALPSLYNSCWPSTRPVCGNYKAIFMWSSSVPRFTGSYLITGTPTRKHTMKKPSQTPNTCVAAQIENEKKC